MRSLFKSTAIALFFLLASASAFASVNEKNAQVLFVMLAKQATIQASSKPNQYQLTLKGVHRKIVYFTDRPERMTGQLKTKTLLANWNKDNVFEKDAPNAVMEAVRVNTETNTLSNKENSYAMTLYHPVVSRIHPDEITFDITMLPGSKATLPLLGTDDYVALFIDRVCLSCIG